MKVDDELTNFFEYNNGMRQGDPLSPTLFNIFVNDLFDEIDSVNKSPVNLYDEEKFSSLVYADDHVMISITKEGFQNMLNKLGEYSQKWNIDVNYTKTKCVTFSKGNRKESHRFTINSQIIENSTTYKYLGITIHKNGSFKSHISELACKANKEIFLMNRKLNIKFIPKKLSLLLYDMLICPILLYGCEIWEPYLDLNYDKWCENPIEKVHTQFLRRLMGVNRSTSNVLMGDLGRLPLQPKMFNNNINYLKYLTNKDNISLVKQAYLYEKRKSEERTTIENSLHKLATQPLVERTIPNVIAESRISL